MGLIKPQNKPGLYSNAIFFVSFGLWLLAVWLVARYGGSLAAVETTDRIMDNISVIPFGIGAVIGLRGLYQRNANPLFPFMGFALNGIMVFRVVYRWLGWAFGW